MIGRRRFLAITLAAASSAAALRLRAEPVRREKPPFRLLYGNDTTNILSCVSPWHKAREPFRREMLEASIDEAGAAGADAHLLQPGLGSVPWWPSKVFSLEEHVAWLRDRFGIGPDPFTKFVIEGGDIVQTFIDRCRATNQAAFVSFRLNDVHDKEFADAQPGENVPGSVAMGVTKFYAEHPEFRIGSSRSAAKLALDWSNPEVRASKFALIRELCENYDLDGLELDFLRFPSFFRLDKTPLEERRKIITEFVRDVRALLDRTTREGRHRWLCVRVPVFLKTLDVIGLDLPALVAAGVEMVNASAHYFTTQQHDLGLIRDLTPGAALYFELCHSIWNGPKLADGYDTFPFRRATREQLQTAAHVAFARGADGISTFNFAYYREHGSVGRGPFAEPPFDVLKKLRDREWIAAQPQHWFLAPGWRAPGTPPTDLPCRLSRGDDQEFTFDLIAPTRGWQRDGRLRVQTAAPLGRAKLLVKFGGGTLEPTRDVSEPFPNGFAGLLGTPENTRAWVVPAPIIREGRNTIEVSMEGANEVQIDYIDFATH